MTEIRPIAYIAGPIRGNPDYRKDFASAEYVLKNYGYHPHNPVRSEPDMTEEQIQKAYDLGDTPWIEKDIDFILKMSKKYGDVIAVLPGWQSAPGAIAEVALAQWKGLTVIDAFTGATVGYTDKSALEIAAATVLARQSTYGPPEVHWERTVNILNAMLGEKYLKQPLPVWVWPVIMIMEKLSRRLSGSFIRDHAIDVAGYANGWDRVEQLDSVSKDSK